MKHIMSQQNYTITNYGIVIPIDNSPQYNHVVKQLISKNKQFYEDLNKDETDFLYELPFQTNQSLHVTYDTESINIITLNGDYREIYATDILILIGNHEEPSLYSAPFKSKEECIRYYKNQFDDLLPKDFDYEGNIGKITYVTWG